MPASHSIIPATQHIQTFSLHITITNHHIHLKIHTILCQCEDFTIAHTLRVKKHGMIYSGSRPPCVIHAPGQQPLQSASSFVGRVGRCRLNGRYFHRLLVVAITEGLLYVASILFCSMIFCLFSIIVLPVYLCW
jgi:hypothetical protein